LSDCHSGIVEPRNAIFLVLFPDISQKKALMQDEIVKNCGPGEACGVGSVAFPADQVQSAARRSGTEHSVAVDVLFKQET
jgi:hypothetical protein